MAEKREYKEMYEKFINYEQDLHLENQKRIRIGLKVNIILPLFFLIMSFAISEGKLVFFGPLDPFPLWHSLLSDLCGVQ